MEVAEEISLQKEMMHQILIRLRALESSHRNLQSEEEMRSKVDPQLIWNLQSQFHKEITSVKTENAMQYALVQKMKTQLTDMEGEIKMGTRKKEDKEPFGEEITQLQQKMRELERIQGQFGVQMGVLMTSMQSISGFTPPNGSDVEEKKGTLGYKKQLPEKIHESVILWLENAVADMEKMHVKKEMWLESRCDQLEKEIAALHMQMEKERTESAAVFQAKINDCLDIIKYELTSSEEKIALYLEKHVCFILFLQIKVRKQIILSFRE